MTRRQRNLWQHWWPENPKIRYSLEAWEVILRITAASGRGHYRLQAVDECKGTPGNARGEKVEMELGPMNSGKWKTVLDKFLHGGVTIGSEWVLSHVQPFATVWTIACQSSLCTEFSRWDTGVGCHSLHQRIFPSQGSYRVSCIGRQILYRWAKREVLVPCSLMDMDVFLILVSSLLVQNYIYYHWKINFHLVQVISVSVLSQKDLISY